MNKRHFDRSGCFKCINCGKQTRNTGDNGSCRLCPVCFERAGWENHLVDTIDGADFGCLDHCTTVAEIEQEAKRLIAKANEGR
jgi:hypothetical protein